MATSSAKIAESANPNILVVSGRDFAAIRQSIANPPKASAPLKAAFVSFCKECPESVRELKSRLSR